MFSFCFGKILQRDLDQIKEYWNCHLIRSSGYATVSGRPDVLFSFPENCGKRSQLQSFNPSDLQEIGESDMRGDYSFENEHELFYEYFNYLMNFLQLNSPTDFHSAKALYIRLKSYER